jgi:hypothetical protein
MEFILPQWPAPLRVRALTTTRGGGVSTGAYRALNLGDHVGDVAERVARNRALLAARAGLPAAPNWLAQENGCGVLAITADAAGAERRADAAVTERPGVVCAVLSADCLPLVLCDQAATVVAVIHAGWRGLLAGVIEAAVAQVGCPPQNLLAWLGPAIGPAAFEVGAEVRCAFVAERPEAAAAFRCRRAAAAPSSPPSGPAEGWADDGRERWLADLYCLARQRLTDAGVMRVSGGGFCTFGDARRFFSYRRDGVTGRMATLAWLDDGPVA